MNHIIFVILVFFYPGFVIVKIRIEIKVPENTESKTNHETFYETDSSRKKDLPEDVLILLHLNNSLPVEITSSRNTGIILIKFWYHMNPFNVSVEFPEMPKGGDFNLQ